MKDIVLLFDFIGGYYYHRESGRPLSEFIPETFAKVTMSPYFQCLRLRDETEDYYLRKEPATECITLKIFKK